jgi:hypothetical protein
MDFVDWCGTVLQTLVKVSQSSALAQAYGVDEATLLEALYDREAGTNTESQPAPLEPHHIGAMFSAVEELKACGFIGELGENSRVWEVTESGRRQARDARAFWRELCGTELDLPEQQQLLHLVNRLSEQQESGYPWLDYVANDDLVNGLNWPDGWVQYRATAQRLIDLGFAKGMITSGTVDLRATYRGLVWETRCVRSRVFVSYRRAPSEAYALLIAEKLAPYGMNVFVDTLSVEGAEPFPERLERGIDECDVFVCLLAPTTLESEWVRREIERAEASIKPMIPIFQPDFVLPDMAALPAPVVNLLNCEGVKINSGYVSEAIEKLAKMIEQTWFARFRASSA